MTTPSGNRTFDAISPSSESESPLDKKDKPDLFPLRATGQTLVTGMDAAAEFKEKYPEVPSWAVALYGKASGTFDELRLLNDRVDKAERYAESAKLLASDAKAIAYEARDQFEELDDRMYKLEVELKKSKVQIQELEDYGRRENLKIDGIPESHDESATELLDKIYGVFENELGLTNVKGIKMDRYHRLGRKGKSTRPRTVIIRFNWHADREKVWNQRFNIQKRNARSKIFVVGCEVG